MDKNFDPGTWPGRHPYLGVLVRRAKTTISSEAARGRAVESHGGMFIEFFIS